MKISLILLVFALFAGNAQAEQSLKSDREDVNSSCSSEAQTAGCGGEVVGHGLLKCLHKYRKAHKDFQMSEGCQSALKKLKENRKEKKKSHS